MGMRKCGIKKYASGSVCLVKLALGSVCQRMLVSGKASASKCWCLVVC